MSRKRYYVVARECKFEFMNNISNFDRFPKAVVDALLSGVLVIVRFCNSMQLPNGDPSIVVKFLCVIFKDAALGLLGTSDNDIVVQTIACIKNDAIGA